MIASMKNVTKVYSTGEVAVTALKNISIDIEKGEFISIAGPSGSGKTTFMNILGTLDKPTEGNVFFDSIDVTKLSKDRCAKLRRDQIGFVFQTYNLIPVLTALENVEFPLVLMGRYSKRERMERAIEMLKNVGLEEYINRKPSEMSGGQQQRVAIARALVKEPKLVLADEPTANLDSRTGAEVLEIMLKMNEKLGTTFIFATHDKMVMDFAKRLINLHDGEIVEDIKR
ncbi:MAG: lipoprotein-releasing system ATP-binding protein LolD [Candidatus Neomarinimicrobiota bacterium]|nr:MAG: lipoprotein-releasing system ATP-binding protein LolD [Candidatus Neomarinimicrobiota bacterium]